MKNVCVLFGGRSSEHDISLISASGVISNIDYEKYNVIPVGITKDGKWYLTDGEIKEFEKHIAEYKAVSVDLAHHGINVFDANGNIEFKYVDVFFPVLHGLYGEDGKIQGLFEMSNIPYVGCDSETSAISMDKAVTKAILNEHGIKQAKAKIIYKHDMVDLDELSKELKYPVFVKPARGGSSIGASKAIDVESLKKAVELAFNEDNKILIEEYIKGREIETAVLEENGNVYVSRPGEIDPGDVFYDFDTKYNNSNASLFIPARISEEAMNKVRKIAKNIFLILEGRGFSRVDFFLTDDGEFIFNEINTIPGFTPISMYPKLMQDSGLTYKELISRLLDGAMG